MTAETPQKRNSSEPTIHFQVQAVMLVFGEGMISKLLEIYKVGPLKPL